ncbi:MAG: HEAT repeat domain-containing protein [Gammaproteobacteria bacterium]|nr:HEAT repeat domain-containing protein [Gammaproteobacteria bacterium]
MKKIIINHSDFFSFIKNGGFFVDKSLLIKYILDIDDEYKTMLITRPRRFGKTLALSMLENFFDRTKKDETKTIFEKLKIWKEHSCLASKHHGNYNTIFISFVSVSNFQSEENFLNQFHNLIKEVYKKHLYFLENDSLSEDEASFFKKILTGKANRDQLIISIANLTKYIKNHSGEKSILLIDEYDMPFQTKYASKSYDYIKDFFRTFINNSCNANEDVKFSVLTGILRVSHENIFSSFKNLLYNSIVSPEEYFQNLNECFGFTDVEVMKILNYFKISESLGKVKTWYGGYQIGNRHLYNPLSIFRFISNNKDKKKYKLYWVETGGNDFFLQKMPNLPIAVKLDFLHLLNNETIYKKIELNTDLNQTFSNISYDEATFWGRLLLTGYLSINSSDNITQKGETVFYCPLIIPNEELITYFQNLAISLFKKNEDVIDFYEDILYELEINNKIEINNEIKDDIKKVIKKIINNVLYLFLIKEDELKNKKINSDLQIKIIKTIEALLNDLSSRNECSAYIYEKFLHFLNNDQNKSILSKPLIPSLKALYQVQANWLERPIAGEVWSITDTFIQLVLILNASKDKSREREEQVHAPEINWHEMYLSPTEKLQAEKKTLPYTQLFQALPSLSNQFSFPEHGAVKQVWVSGAAGSGKSVLIQRLAYEWCQWEQEAPGTKPSWLPEGVACVIWVKLRELKSYLDLEDIQQTEQDAKARKLIRRRRIPRDEDGQLDSVGALSVYLSSKRYGWNTGQDSKEWKAFLEQEATSVLWLVDGYDEIASLSQADPVQDLFHRFFLRQPWVIVTSRPYYRCPVEGKKQIRPFRQVELLGFSQKSMLAYLEKHFMGQIKGAGYNALKQLLTDDMRVRGLAHVPVNLEILCTVMSASPELTLNEPNTTQLYTLLFFYLLKRAKEKGLLSPGFALEGTLLNEATFLSSPKTVALLKGLGQLALKGLEEKRLLFEAQEVKKVFLNVLKPVYGDDERAGFQDMFQVGWLRGLRWLDNRQDFQGQGEFLHLTLQEYFAAHYFAQEWLEDKKRPECLMKIKQYKYAQSFARCWPFVAGLLAEQEGKTGLNDFIMTLDSPPFSLIGHHHTLLRIRCLEELLPQNAPFAWEGFVVQLVQKLLEDYYHTSATIRDELQSSPTWGKYVAFRLVEALRQGDRQTQEKVLKIVVFFGPMVATPKLVTVLTGLLQDNNGSVRQLVFEAIDALGLAAATPALLDGVLVLLQGNDGQACRLACQIIYRLGSTAATPAILNTLVILLQNKDEVIRRSSCRAMSKLGAAATMPDFFLAALLRLLQDGMWRVRQAACEAFSQLGPTPAIPEVLRGLVPLLQDNVWRVREAACGALTWLGPAIATKKELLKKFMPLLQDKAWEVRRAACRMLGQMVPVASKSMVLAELGALMQDNVWQVRQAACEALVQLGSAAAALYILEKFKLLLQDEVREVRQAACRMLGQMGPAAVTPEILAMLKSLLQDEVREVRQTACEALGQLRPVAVTPRILTWVSLLKNNEESVRWAACRALGQLGPTVFTPEAVDALYLLAKDHSWAVRGALVGAFLQLGRPVINPAYLEVWIGLLGDDDSTVREETSQLLYNWMQYWQESGQHQNFKNAWLLWQAKGYQTEESIKSAIHVAIHLLPSTLFVTSLEPLLKVSLTTTDWVESLPNLLLKGLQHPETEMITMSFIEVCLAKETENYLTIVYSMNAHERLLCTSSKVAPALCKKIQRRALQGVITDKMGMYEQELLPFLLYRQAAGRRAGSYLIGRLSVEGNVLPELEFEVKALVIEMFFNSLDKSVTRNIFFSLSLELFTYSKAEMPEKIINSVTKQDLMAFGSGAFNMLQESQLSQSGKLLKSEKLSEKGFIACIIVEGIFESAKLQQLNHGKMQVFLTNLAAKITVSQDNFLREVIKVNDDRTKLLEKFLTSTDNKLKTAQDQMNAKLTIIIDKYFSSDNPITMTDNDVKALEIAERMLANNMRTYTEMVTKATEAGEKVISNNKIDDQMITNCIEANKVVMTSLFDTIKELGKAQQSSVQMLVGTGTTIINGVIGNGNNNNNNNQNPKQKALQAPGANSMFNQNNNAQTNSNAANNNAGDCQGYAQNLINDLHAIPADKKQEFIAKLTQILTNNANFNAIKGNRAQRNGVLVKIKAEIETSIPAGIAQTLSDLAEIVDECCKPTALQPHNPK